MTAADLAEAQLRAYNAKDLDAFCACYSDDVEVYRMPSMTPAVVGLAKFRANYVATFNNPAVHATVPTRVTMGNKCMDHELCFKAENSPPVELMVMYETRADKIFKVTFYYNEDK
ncbi:hypothetical protein DYB37_006917 [Aphanomyces astaci]|nr:hypothetical protein DYB36_013185 [Aphanomyces astaci]RHY08697.1 hypothetical protein DYB25_008998 [Aphanomyces astaci]RHY89996.1 hypothetical protein DYB35_004514 [Aphanomyces astaci]RHZ17073.1 hypothetical protein DYB37_006917 [Aphanomyces astaci]RHZ23536.1 hypothetical protein DYB31_005367 [Aphanomyces astaci]